MTGARFLSNNSVISETNHVKCKTLMHGSWVYRNRSKESLLWGDFLPKVEFFAILGAAFPPFGTDWREVLHGQADPSAPWLFQISRESLQRVVPVGRKC